jgi:uncharacterized protein (DUF433 family)
MDDQPHTWKYLAPKPGSHYRQLFVAGTRIAAWVLYNYYTPGEEWPGQTAEEIATSFNLPVEAVREAITYCQSNPAELQEDWRKEEALAATGGNLAKAEGGGPAKKVSAEDYARIFLR